MGSRYNRRYTTSTVLCGVGPWVPESSQVVMAVDVGVCAWEDFGVAPTGGRRHVPRPYFSLSAPDAGRSEASGSIDWTARRAAAAAGCERRRVERARVTAEFAEARAHGLAARHATKLTRL